jgi:hypothetical protein
VTEEADDPLDRLFEAVEILECRIDLDRPVQEDAAEARVLLRVDDLGFADRRDHAFRRAGIHHRIVHPAKPVFLTRQGAFSGALFEMLPQLVALRCSEPSRAHRNRAYRVTVADRQASDRSPLWSAKLKSTHCKRNGFPDEPTTDRVKAATARPQCADVRSAA